MHILHMRGMTTHMYSICTSICTYAHLNSVAALLQAVTGVMTTHAESAGVVQAVTGVMTYFYFFIFSKNAAGGRGAGGYRGDDDACGVR